MELVDTSIWIAVLRKSDPLDLSSVADLEEIVTCLPVIQEVLQGFRDEAAFRTAREAMFALPDDPVVDGLPDRRVRAPKRPGRAASRS